MTDLAPLLQAWQPAATLRRAWLLHGGVSAVVHGLEFEQHGRMHKVVLRQYGPRDLARNLDLAEAEFRLLHFLHGTGLPVPQPLHHESGVLFIEFMQGESGVDTAPDPLQLAHFLAQLHALNIAGLDIQPLPEISPAPARPDDSLSETRIREALTSQQPPQKTKSAFLHGDFWPGNTLWQDGNLTAAIDWEDSALGEALYDLGVARLELLFFHGPPLMQAFTDEYERLTGADLSALPYWDLRAALRPCGCMSSWNLDPDQEARMRERHGWFVEQALRPLEGRS